MLHFQYFLEVKWWNFYIKASVLLCLLSVNTGFLWLVHVPLSRYHVIVEAGLHPPHQNTPSCYGASFQWPQVVANKEVDAAGEAGGIHSRARWWLKVRFYQIACWKLQLLTADKKKGWVTSAFQATQWHQLPSHKKITSSYVATTDAATPPLWCRFGVKTRQGHQHQTKVRWLVMKRDNKRSRTNYCYKNSGEKWRRVGQIGLLPFGQAVIHQQAQQQGLGGSAGRADT